MLFRSLLATLVSCAAADCDDGEFKNATGCYACDVAYACDWDGFKWHFNPAEDCGLGTVCLAKAALDDFANDFAHICTTDYQYDKKASQCVAISTSIDDLVADLGVTTTTAEQDTVAGDIDVFEQAMGQPDGTVRTVREKLKLKHKAMHLMRLRRRERTLTKLRRELANLDVTSHSMKVTVLHRYLKDKKAKDATVTIKMQKKEDHGG